MRAVSVAGAVLVWAAGTFFGSTFISQAQMQMQPVQAQPDSVVQVVADAQGLPLVSPDQIPRFGTFWVVSGQQPPVPLPFLPYDPTNTPVFSLSEGQFLVDATGGAVPQPTRRQALLGVSASALVQAQANAVLDFIAWIQEAQTNTGLDDLAGGSSFQGQVLTTNDLWLQMVGVTNQTATLIIHPPWNVANGVYDLLYNTNLSTPSVWRWLLRCNPGQTNLVVPNAAGAQGFYRLGPPNDLAANDSLGTNFWVMFFYMYNAYAEHLWLYISSPVGATGTVTIPGLGITNAFSVAAGAVTNISIPGNAMMNDYDVVGMRGIHITASQPVAVYGLNFDNYLSAAFTGYPTSLLGTNYCIMARACLLPSAVYGNGCYSQLAIVATADNTTVTITPSPTANLAGHSTLYTTNLQQGETYQINSRNVTGNDITNDVTGTLITSDKPVGVFAGASVTFVPDTNTLSGNPLVQEQLPVDSWGTQALALSFAGRTNGDTYRVLAAYSNTVVTISGEVVTIVDEPGTSPWTVTTNNEVVVVTNQAGQFYDIIVDGPVVFHGSKPIQVAQFANGGYSDHATNAAGNQFGDPCEILLPPTGHYLVTNIVITPPNGAYTGDFDENYLNLIVSQSAITNTLVDGLPVAVTNFVAIGTSGYYGAQLTVTNGVHTVTSSQPVGVEVYGFAKYDAYSYFGGIVK